MNPFTVFADTAVRLSRNPLGIIALFIVLVYAMASFVAVQSSSNNPDQFLVLTYFLVFFPVLVLAAFVWLVSQHSDKLYAPSDFKNEENFLQLKMQTVGYLSAAAAKQQNDAMPDIGRIVRSVGLAAPSQVAQAHDWKSQILWVDDHPENNVFERRAFEANGLEITTALSTDEAFAHLERGRYATIISDMGRMEGFREGYALLDRLREKGDQTPLFFYSGSNAPEHKKETIAHGGQGCTNDAGELFEMVTRAVIEQGRI